VVNNSTSQHSLLSGWRITFYSFAVLWILLQLAFVRESSRFGWGFSRGWGPSLSCLSF